MNPAEVSIKNDKRGEERMIDALAKVHSPFRSSDRMISATP
jgi:hypothetical protein